MHIQCLSKVRDGQKGIAQSGAAFPKPRSGVDRRFSLRVERKGFLRIDIGSVSMDFPADI